MFLQREALPPVSVASIRAGLGSLSDAEVAMLLQQVRAATAALQPEEDAGS